MTGYWMGIPCAAGELEKTCYRFLFSSLLSPAVWCVVTGTQLYHLTIIHFLPAVTHLTSCLVWILFISRDSNWSWFQTRPYRIQFWWRLFQFHSLNWFKACLKFNPPVIDRAKSGVMPALVNFPLSRPILSSDSVSWEADQPPVTADTGTMLFVCLEILIVSGSHAESRDAETLRSVRMERNYVGPRVE